MEVVLNLEKKQGQKWHRKINYSSKTGGRTGLIMQILLKQYLKPLIICGISLTCLTFLCHVDPLLHEDFTDI